MSVLFLPLFRSFRVVRPQPSSRLATMIPRITALQCSARYRSTGSPSPRSRSDGACTVEHTAREDVKKETELTEDHQQPRATSRLTRVRSWLRSWPEEEIEVRLFFITVSCFCLHARPLAGKDDVVWNSEAKQEENSPARRPSARDRTYEPYEAA